jgi:hypothetical protein
LGQFYFTDKVPMDENGLLFRSMELTWYGKDEPIRIEPRLLIENASLSNTATDPDTENMIIHGDNLLELKALEKELCKV